MRAQKTIWPTIVLICLMVLSSCVSFHPLGISDSEWNILTPEQKIAAREKQAKLTAQKKQILADQKIAKETMLAKRYTTARYGDIISVSITSGTMDIHSKRREYEPIAFDLIRGEIKEIDVVRKGKRYQKDIVVVRLSEDGRTFYFDDKQQNRLVLVDENWDRGKTYNIKELSNKNTNPQNIKIKVRYRHIEKEPTHENDNREIIIIR